MTRLILIPLCLCAALGLSACGKLGALERPGPASGPDVGPDPMKASRTVDPRNRNADPSPEAPATEPAPGAASPQ